MATKNEKKAYYATRTFGEQGVGSFLAGDEVAGVTEGQIANYVAAGLASHDKPKSGAEAEIAALDATLG